jgi:hypothetical protein
MYTPGTVLKLKEPKSTDESKKGADDAVVFPYDRVMVIGVSPISHSGQATGEWEGISAQGVLIRPLSDFASNLDEPLGRLQTLYAIESEPERQEVEVRVERYDANTRAAGPSPEEAFAEADGRSPGTKSKTRERTPHSPLQDLAEEVAEPASPLERITRDRARVAKGGLKNEGA